MKKNFIALKNSFYFLLLLIGFTACEKEDIPEPGPDLQSSLSGVFILNQGVYGSNNAALSYYDFETGKIAYDIAVDLAKGKIGLGDTGQDMIAYGSKLYVSVNGSSLVSVFDLKSKAYLKDIRLADDAGKPRGPRNLVSYNGKVYVTTYDGYVVRIDTTLLIQDGITKVGANPDGIAAVNGKLYVANSGGLNYLVEQVQDSTLSVVDIATFREEAVLTVGLNPNIVHADSYGDVYLTYRGDFYNIPGGFQRIDTKTHTVTNLPVSANENFTIVGDSLYIYCSEYGQTPTFSLFNVKTEQLITDRLITDGTTINTAYGIGVDPKTRDVYISDTDYENPGLVYIFAPDGKKKKTLNVGISACQFVFY
jgi:hypothetical protein